MESITSVVRHTPKRCGDFTWYQGQYVIKNRSGLTGGQSHTDGIFDADTAVNATLTSWMCRGLATLLAIQFFIPFSGMK